MGYTSFYAGLVLGPGGIATMLAMPVVGKLIGQGQPQAVPDRRHLDLRAQHLHDVPLQPDHRFLDLCLAPGRPRPRHGHDLHPAHDHDAFAHPERDDDRGKLALQPAQEPRRQLRHRVHHHHARPAAPSSTRRGSWKISRPSTRPTRWRHDRIGSALAAKGLPPAGADGALYGELVRQATTLAFTDAFLMICLLILCVLPLVFIMQRPGAPAAGPPAAH